MYKVVFGGRRAIDQRPFSVLKKFAAGLWKAMSAAISLGDKAKRLQSGTGWNLLILAVMGEVRPELTVFGWYSQKNANTQFVSMTFTRPVGDVSIVRTNLHPLAAHALVEEAARRHV
jgi:hypothetical protein